MQNQTPNTPKDKTWTVQERAKSLGFEPSEAQLAQIEVLVAQLYRERHGFEPLTQEASSMSAKDEVLYAFAVEPIQDKETLKRYLRDYPEYGSDLIDLSYELHRPANEPTTVSDEQQRVVEAAIAILEVNERPLGEARKARLDIVLKGEEEVAPTLLSQYLRYLNQNPCVEGSREKFHWNVGFWAGVRGEKADEARCTPAYLEGWGAGNNAAIEEQANEISNSNHTNHN
ncbi:MAG: hypothetical protein AAGD25_06490 [Cyanobacteria bacterium P01_F01_bin.150]